MPIRKESSMGVQLDDVTIRRMTVNERLDLVDRICDSLEEETIEIGPALKKELRRRLAAIDANPNSGSPWEDAKARIQSRLHDLRSSLNERRRKKRGKRPPVTSKSRKG